MGAFRDEAHARVRQAVGMLKPGLADEDRRRVLVRGAAGSFLLNVAWAGLGFGSHVLLARLLGKTHYGDYAYVFSWIAVLTLFGVLGYDKAAVRYLAAYRAAGEWDRYRGMLRRGALMVAASSCLLGGLTAAIAFSVSGDWRPELLHTFWAGAALVPILAFATAAEGAIQSLKKPVQAQINMYVFRPILLMSTAVAYWWWTGADMQGPDAMACYAFAAVVAMLLNIALLWVRLPNEGKWGIADYGPSRDWWAMALPMVLMAGMTMVLRQAAVLMIGVQVGTAEAGVYSAATRIVDILAFALVAVDMIAAPMFAELTGEKHRAELQRILTLAAWCIFAVCVPFSIALILSGRFILGLFGDGFDEAYWPLVVLIGGQTVNVCSGSVGYLLSMTGNQRIAATIIFAASVLNVGLCWILIPRFGLMGAAFATAICTVGWNVGMLIAVRKQLRVNPTVFRLRRS